MVITEETGNEDTPIVITRSEYQQLLEDSRLLRALRASGVDSWEGYELALRMISSKVATVSDE